MKVQFPFSGWGSQESLPKFYLGLNCGSYNYLN